MAQNTRRETQRKRAADPGQLRCGDHRSAAADALRRRQFRSPNDHQQQRRAVEGRARFSTCPSCFSTVETKSFSGNMWPQIQAVFPNQTPIERTTMNSVGRPELRRRHREERQEEDRPVRTVDGDLRGASDRCRRFTTATKCTSSRTAAATSASSSHDNAMKRVIQAGAKPVTALSVMLEWQRDWAAARHL